MEKYDVVVVGYGPVSQSLVNLLGKQGHKVAAFEKYPSLWGSSRAGHIDGEAMRMYQSLELASELEVLMRPIKGFELVSASGEVLHRGRLGEGGNGWKASYLIHQPQIERVLDRSARAKEGVEVFMGWEAVSIKNLEDRVELVVKARETGEEKTVQASFLVGADGAKSFVRGAQGIDQVDLGFEPYEFLVVDFEHSNPDRSIPSMGEVRQFLDPARPTTVGRWNGNQWSRWEFMCLPGDTAATMESEERCWELLKPWGISQTDGRIARKSVYRFESRVASRWRENRVVLVGDAAHTTPPFRAQGLCSGLRDVVNLSWKLDAILNNHAGLALLDTYEEERRPHVEQLIQEAMAIGRLATVTDPDVARVRDDDLRSGGKLDIHGLPDLVAGLIQATESAEESLAGKLSPQARVHRAGRTALLDDFTGANWRIVSRHPVPTSIQSKYQKLLKALGMQLVHVTKGCLEQSYLDIDGEYTDWFMTNGVEAFLQRPDFHIYGSAQSVEELDDVLRSLAQQWAAYNASEEYHV
jgi:2-polyprenyl-6-methoxyphenol hydroxylase-like FAD-dependent oxidoreductase